jgi:hypothetical protein
MENLYIRGVKHGIGTQRFKCDPKVGGGCGWHGTRPVGIEQYENRGIDRRSADALHRKLRGERGVRRYVITAAQNATPVWQPFFKALKNYCRWNGAQLIVIPYRYKNPTSIWSQEAKDDDRWDPPLTPYLLDRRIELNKHLVLLADVKTQPTATAPLQGFETMTGSRSAIIGHPKLELVTVPTPQERLPKILTTTGAVTERNYIPSKAGKKGEHHHTFGACVVELEGGLFHIRQINAVKDGTFCDLEYEYSQDFRRQAAIAALVMGDTHVKFVDPDVDAATWGKGGLVDELRPEQVVWHDLHDGFSHNHWHEGHLVTNYVKHHTGNNDIERELRQSCDFLAEKAKAYPKVRHIIVDSNHPRWLSQWLNRINPRYDLQNVVFWARTLEMVAGTARMGDSGVEAADPFVLWAKQMLPAPVLARTKFLRQDESHLIMGIECGMHGDRGANGAKGSPRTFAKLGVKSVTGDGHSPWIKDGAYRVGTNTRLKLSYTAGPSSWLHTDCLIYSNGKRTLINVIDGKWRVPAAMQLRRAA